MSRTKQSGQFPRIVVHTTELMQLLGHYLSVQCGEVDAAIEECARCGILHARGEGFFEVDRDFIVELRKYF